MRTNAGGRVRVWRDQFAWALAAAVGLLLRESAREQLVEVDGRQHEVRESTLRHAGCDTATRAYGNSTFGQMRADGAALVVGVEAAHREQAGLLDLDEERGGFALLGAHGHRQHHFIQLRREPTLAVVLMSSEICGLQLPSMRGPFGASYEQSLR